MPGYRLNARLTRLVVAFSRIESKRCKLTSVIAQNATLYASVQMVPLRKIEQIEKKPGFFFFFLFLQRAHSGASPLFKTLCGLPTEENSMTLQFAGREFSGFDDGVMRSSGMSSQRDGR